MTNQHCNLGLSKSYIQDDAEQNEKWYIKFLYVPIFLKFIHSMLATFIMDGLMYEPIV